MHHFTSLHGIVHFLIYDVSQGVYVRKCVLHIIHERFYDGLIVLIKSYHYHPFILRITAKHNISHHSLMLLNVMKTNLMFNTICFYASLNFIYIIRHQITFLNVQHLTKLTRYMKPKRARFKHAFITFFIKVYQPSFLTEGEFKLVSVSSGFFTTQNRMNLKI